MIVGIFAKQIAKRTLRNKKLLNKATKRAMSKPGKTFTVTGAEGKALGKALKSSKAFKTPMTMAQKRALIKAQKAAARANRK